MRVIWSDDAVEDYFQNINYLLAEWPENVASDFIAKVESAIQLILRNPAVHPISSYKQIRKGVITKHITMYYRTDDDAIYIVRFWNNFQDPTKLKFS